MEKTKYKGIYKVQEGILLNKDAEALALYKVRKQKMREQTDRVDGLENDVREMRNDLQEIKELLKGLVK